MNTIGQREEDNGKGSVGMCRELAPGSCLKAEDKALTLSFSSRKLGHSLGPICHLSPSAQKWTWLFVSPQQMVVESILSFEGMASYP